MQNLDNSYDFNKEPRFLGILDLYALHKVPSLSLSNEPQELALCSVTSIENMELFDMWG